MRIKPDANTTLLKDMVPQKVYTLKTVTPWHYIKKGVVTSLVSQQGENLTYKAVSFSLGM